MKKALLVIDIQQDFTGTNARMPVEINQAQRMIEIVNSLVEKAQQLNLLVVYIGNEYSRFDPLNIFRRFAAIRNTYGAQFDPRLNVATNHYFPKSRDDAFSNPDLIRFLKEQGVETVILTGLYAEACIWGSLKGAQKNGFKAEIFSDAIATKTESKRQAMLQRYSQFGARLVNDTSEL